MKTGSGTWDKPPIRQSRMEHVANRAHSLRLLLIKAHKTHEQIPAPIRCDCADGKCGQCHDCRKTQQVPVAIRTKGATQ
jgi:hypothetical protein